MMTSPVACIHNNRASTGNAALSGQGGVVFGKPLKDSLAYASVQISTANASGELYVWGYIPVVVAKWCVYDPLPTYTVALTLPCTAGCTLRRTVRIFDSDIAEPPSLNIFGPATEVEGTFRVPGSNKRMRDLQTAFETPPRVRERYHPPLVATPDAVY